MNTALRCSGLVKTYPGKPPIEAVRGVDLTVAVGECFGLLGPNGAGKTTTLEILEGLLPPTAGEVEIFGLRWDRDAAAIRERIGISLQETKLSDKLTVLETVRLFRSFYTRGLTPEDAVAQVDLSEKSSTKTDKLSGGQRQRLAVACALVGAPELLFLDEPTTGLDPQSRRRLWEVIRNFKEQGRTVVLTTHYMDEAERLCDRVAIVDQGKVIALGSPRELIGKFGGENVLEFEPSSREHLSPAVFLDLPTVRDAQQNDSLVVLKVGGLHRALPALLERLRALGVEPNSLTTRHANLEDVFVALTGRHLREEGTGS